MPLGASCSAPTRSGKLHPVAISTSQNNDIPRAGENSSIKRRFEAPWLILVALLFATILAAWQNHKQARIDAERRFAEMADSAALLVRDNVQRVEDTTADVAAMAAITSNLDVAKWNAYFAKRRESSEPVVGLKRLEYWRLGEADTEGTAKGSRFVYDIAAHNPRIGTRDLLPRIPASALSDTMQLAKATGNATVTPPLQIDVKDPARYLVMVRYVLSKTGTASVRTDTPIDEYIIAVLRMDDVLGAISRRYSNRLQIDVEDNGRPLMPVINAPSTNGANSGNAYAHVSALNVGQRKWSLRATSTATLEEELESRAPRTILMVGVLGTVLLAGLVWLLTRLREQANNLATNMTEKLRDQAKFTEDLIELNPNPIFRKDAQGRFTAVNRAWEQLSGRDRRDVLGKTNSEFQRPDIAEESETHDRQLFNSQAGYEAREVFITNTAGREFQTIVAKQVLKRRDGTVDGLIGTITDVTPIKQLERRLARQQEQLDLVIRSSQQGIWDIELTKGGNAYFSERFQEVLGFAPGTFPTSFLWRDWLHPEDRGHFAAEMARCFKQEVTFFDVECRARQSSGNYIWIRARGIAQHNAAGRAHRFVGSIVDITDRKVAEENLIEANVRVTDAARAKEAFLATMSHEIRTPLNGVLGMASLLADTSLNDEQRDYIRLVRASGDTLLRLIDDVLDFSKIESGRMPLETVTVEIVAIVEEAFELVAEKARDKDLTLIYDIADDVPYYILGDPTRLRQILLNLLSNAIKFTNRGEVRCELIARTHSDGKVEIEGRVVDTGIGIPIERIGQLFQPFTQVDASTTRKYGGTGLGLAIVKRLTESMGGATRVESVEGEGSSFIFTILTQITRGPLRPYMQRNLPEFRDKSALLTDNNLRSLSALSQRLSSWGLNVRACASDQAARVMREDGPFDIVLTDMVHPRDVARELQAAIRERNVERVKHGLPPAVVILHSALQRAELSARSILPVIAHDMFVVRPVGRARLFDVLLRAATHAPTRDVATRPYSPETPNEASSRGDKSLRKSGGNSTKTARPAPQVFEAANAIIDERLPSLDILVAEDNEVNQVVIQGMLRKLNHRVTMVGNGRLAVNTLMERPFDLVLMDIQMPVLDGIAAMHEIRKIFADRPGARIPPIIAMTANALAGDREHYMTEGMDDYVSKPIRPTELNALIERVLPESKRLIATIDNVSNPASIHATHGLLSMEKTVIDASPPLPILDLDQLEDMRDLPSGDPNDTTSGAHGLIALFRKKSDERMTEMQNELIASNWLALGDTAHSMRGAAASIGFPRVAAACKRIEVAARRLAPKPGVPPQPTDTPPPTHGEMDEMYDDIKVRYYEANQALNKWLKG